MADRDLNAIPPALLGSRDLATGEVYFPRRMFAADGSLRECETIELSTTGVLYSWTSFLGNNYGQVDLPEGVRLQCRLQGDVHEIGATYRLVNVEADPDHWSFARA